MSSKLRPSTKLMLRWILRRAKLNEISELEIDLRVFNNWVSKKRGSEYDRKTIREAIAQLDERTQGMICVLKSYSPWEHKIIVRPLAFVLRENSQKQGTIPKPTTGNPMYDGEHKKRLMQQQQQNISKIDSLLRSLGLKYDYGALNRIWRLAGKSIDNLKEAVELLLFRSSVAKQTDGEILNPQGYLMDILKKGYYKDFHMYYDGIVELPFFHSGSEILHFVRDVFKPPQSKPQYQT